MTTTLAATRRTNIVKVVAASPLGTAIEWHDFFRYPSPRHSA